MVNIQGTTINMTRGDSLIATVSPKDKATGQDYVVQEGDSFRFVMRNKKMTSDKSAFVDADPLLTKEIPSDTLILELEPEDTKPFGFGAYFYDIQLTTAQGLVDTFIYEATINLKPEGD